MQAVPACNFRMFIMAHIHLVGLAQTMTNITMYLFMLTSLMMLADLSPGGSLPGKYVVLISSVPIVIGYAVMFDVGVAARSAVNSGALADMPIMPSTGDYHSFSSAREDILSAALAHPDPGEVYEWDGSRNPLLAQSALVPSGDAPIPSASV